MKEREGKFIFFNRISRISSYANLISYHTHYILPSSYLFVAVAYQLDLNFRIDVRKYWDSMLSLKNMQKQSAIDWRKLGSFSISRGMQMN